MTSFNRSLVILLLALVCMVSLATAANLEYRCDTYFDGNPTLTYNTENCLLPLQCPSESSNPLAIIQCFDLDTSQAVPLQDCLGAAPNQPPVNLEGVTGLSFTTPLTCTTATQFELLCSNNDATIPDLVKSCSTISPAADSGCNNIRYVHCTKTWSVVNGAVDPSLVSTIRSAEFSSDMSQCQSALDTGLTSEDKVAIQDNIGTSNTPVLALTSNGCSPVYFCALVDNLSTPLVGPSSQCTASSFTPTACGNTVNPVIEISCKSYNQLNGYIASLNIAECETASNAQLIPLLPADASTVATIPHSCTSQPTPAFLCSTTSGVKISQMDSCATVTPVANGCNDERFVHCLMKTDTVVGDVDGVVPASSTPTYIFASNFFECASLDQTDFQPYERVLMDQSTSNDPAANFALSLNQCTSTYLCAQNDGIEAPISVLCDQLNTPRTCSSTAANPTFEIRCVNGRDSVTAADEPLSTCVASATNKASVTLPQGTDNSLPTVIIPQTCTLPPTTAFACPETIPALTEIATGACDAVTCGYKNVYTYCVETTKTIQGSATTPTSTDSSVHVPLKSCTPLTSFIPQHQDVINAAQDTDHVLLSTVACPVYQCSATDGGQLGTCTDRVVKAAAPCTYDLTTQFVYCTQDSVNRPLSECSAAIDANVDSTLPDFVTAVDSGAIFFEQAATSNNIFTQAECPQTIEFKCSVPTTVSAGPVDSNHIIVPCTAAGTLAGADWTVTPCDAGKSDNARTIMCISSSSETAHNFQWSYYTQSANCLGGLVNGDFDSTTETALRGLTTELYYDEVVNKPCTATIDLTIPPATYDFSACTATYTPTCVNPHNGAPENVSNCDETGLQLTQAGDCSVKTSFYSSSMPSPAPVANQVADITSFMVVEPSWKDDIDCSAQAPSSYYAMCVTKLSINSLDTYFYSTQDNCDSTLSTTEVVESKTLPSVQCRQACANTAPNASLKVFDPIDGAVAFSDCSDSTVWNVQANCQDALATSHNYVILTVDTLKYYGDLSLLTADTGIATMISESTSAVCRFTCLDYADNVIDCQDALAVNRDDASQCSTGFYRTTQCMSDFSFLSFGSTQPVTISTCANAGVTLPINADAIKFAQITDDLHIEDLVVPDVENCLLKCQNELEWVDCVGFTPSFTSDVNCDVSLDYTTAYINPATPNTPFFTNHYTPHTTDVSLCAAECDKTACDTPICHYTPKDTPFSVFIIGSAACDLTNAACGCTKPQSLTLDNFKYKTDGIEPKCGDLVDFVVDVTTLKCSIDGTLVPYTLCWTAEELEALSFEAKFNCNHVCTACSTGTCTGTFDLPAQVLPPDVFTQSCSADCACTVFTENPDGEWVSDLSNSRYTYQAFTPNTDPELALENETCGSITATRQLRCQYPDSTVSTDMSCIADNDVSIVFAGACSILDRTCTTCSGDYKCAFTTTSDANSPSFTVEIAKNLCPAKPPSCGCTEVCVDDESFFPMTEPADESLLITHSVNCARPVEKMCIAWSPSTERDMICLDSQNIRVPCDTIESDLDPDASCTVACYPASYSTFDEANAAHAVVGDCTKNTLRTQLGSDVCPTNVETASTYRSAACVYKDALGQFVDTTDITCANYANVIAQEWKPEDCIASCVAIKDAALIPAVGQPFDVSTDGFEVCTADSFKSTKTACFYTQFSAVRSAVCTLDGIVVDSESCISAYITGAFPTDTSKCTTMCAPAGVTFPTDATDGAITDAGFIKCTNDAFRPSYCGAFTAEEVREIRQVACVYNDGSNFIHLDATDCLLTETATATMYNQDWIGSTECVNYCVADLTDLLVGDQLTVINSEECNVDTPTFPAHTKCGEEIFERFAVCAIPSADGLSFTIDMLTKCSGADVPITKITYPASTEGECAPMYKCYSEATAPTAFADFIECTQTHFIAKCAKHCGEHILTDNAVCMHGKAQANGSIEVTTCDNVSVPSIPCPCEQQCRPTNSDNYVTCDDSTSWFVATTCGGLDTRDVAIKTATGGYITDCTAVDVSCGDIALPAAKRAPLDITGLCTDDVEIKCATTGTTDLAAFATCDNDASFPSCTDSVCGLTGLTREVECIINGMFKSDAITAIDAAFQAAYTTAFDTLCTTDFSPTKSCTCTNALFCVDPIITAPSNGNGDYKSCDADYGFKTCKKYCVDDSMIENRSLYCRNASGDFIKLADTNALTTSECKNIQTPPSFSKTCVGTESCAAEWFCNTLGSSPPVNGIISDALLCTPTNYFSETCFAKVADSFVEQTCITPSDDPDNYYRRRAVNCLVYVPGTQGSYPALDGVEMPSDLEKFCGTKPADAITNCSTQEGCTESIDDVALSTTSANEMSNVSVTWNYVGPSASSKMVQLQYAYAVVSDKTSSALIWVTITAVVKATAKTYSWTLPQLDRTLALNDLYVRASIVTTPSIYIYAPKITVAYVKSCATTNCGNSANLASPSCSLVLTEPICQCITPTTATTFPQPTPGDTWQYCDRTAACDAASNTACQNGGYLKYISSSSSSNQCDTQCTCPGGQLTQDCSGSCPTTCDPKKGSPSKVAGECQCAKCWRGSAGRYCQDCTALTSIVISKPTTEARLAFEQQTNGAGFRTLFSNNFLSFVQATTGYDGSVIAYDSDLSHYNATNDEIVTFFQFTGACENTSPFQLQVTPSLSTATGAWDAKVTRAAVQSSLAFRQVTSTESIASPKSVAQTAAITPAEVIDCKLDSSHPSCPGSKSDDDKSTTIIIAVVCAVGGVLIIGAIIVLVICCSSKTGGSNADKSSDKSSSKPAKVKQKPVDNGTDHLELV